jgi:RNA polymerase sigma-70 factor (ECF subfamily)
MNNSGESRSFPSQEASDEFNVARVAAQRDLEAFAALYDRYAHVVHALAAHVLGATEAEDAVQEVFLRLWDKAYQFDSARSRFNTWFMAVARHHILDLLRKRSLQQRLAVGQKIEQVLASQEDPVDDVVERTWLRQCSDVVLRALGNLPPEQRQALVLAYFGGFSQSAIANQLHWPLGTVKKRIRLGLQKLRTALAQQGLLVDSHGQPRKVKGG